MTTRMAGQKLRKNFDGHFRFPRNHINGKSLEEFSVPELIVLRNHLYAIWEAYHNLRLSSRKKGIDLPVWPKEVNEAHNLEIDTVQEIGRRRRV